MNSSPRTTSSSEIPNEQQAQSTEACISVDQLRSLVRLVDESDTTELEVKHAVAKTRIVLRKARSLESGGTHTTASFITEQTASPPEEAQCTIRAALVGTFHTWVKVKERHLVIVGDMVEKGQPVGIIQSLDIPNEVDSPVTGRVVEILVQDGQPVEYGQPLVTLVILEKKEHP